LILHLDLYILYSHTLHQYLSQSCWSLPWLTRFRTTLPEPQKVNMSEESVLSKWQQRLLPLMSSMLVVLTLFFCVGITVETYRVQKHLEEGHEIDLKPTFNLFAADQIRTFSDRMDLARFQTAALLESNALQSRYHQANVAQLMRICIIFLGFLTGMVLALVGAAFILGKLRENASNVSGEGAGWKLAVTSSSPGILLAVLGTSLRMATIWARVEVNVTDAAL
jgi:hypothetical protein